MGASFEFHLVGVIQSFGCPTKWSTNSGINRNRSPKFFPTESTSCIRKQPMFGYFEFSSPSDEVSRGEV